MKDPNEDTEWNDALRKKGIIPEKEKGITEEQIVQMMEKTIQDRQKTSNIQQFYRLHFTFLHYELTNFIAI